MNTSGRSGWSERIGKDRLVLKNQPLIAVILDAYNNAWTVVVRDFNGGEFCRRKYDTRPKALEGERQLRELLAGCQGDVLGALEHWAGCRVQVPIWWER
jgi:hypothetical protein